MNPIFPIHTGNDIIDQTNMDDFVFQQHLENQRIRNEMDLQNMQTQAQLNQIKRNQNLNSHIGGATRTKIVNDTIGSAIVKGIVSIVCLLIILFFLDKWQIPQNFIQQMQNTYTQAENVST